MPVTVENWLAELDAREFPVVYIQDNIALLWSMR